MASLPNPALNNPEIRRAFEEEYLLGETTATIDGVLESLGIARAELAERLGVSRGRVSQMLGGEDNLTLKSLAAVGWALGLRFELMPQAMADRSGTPAADDQPAPAWLSSLRSTARVTICSEPISWSSKERKRGSTPIKVGADGEFAFAA